MPLAAILCATAPSFDSAETKRGQLVFATQSLTEYQARQAIYAGADTIFIMIEAVTPGLSRMVDRLGADGVDVHLVRDMTTLVRQLPRNEDVLLFADGMVADQRYVSDLAESEGNGLVVVGDDSATEHFERIDGTHRWAGVARITPHTLFNTMDLIGDWDLMLTLLRAVVQNDPKRIVVDQGDVLEGRVALIDRQETADLVGKNLARPSDVDAGRFVAGVERYLLYPVTHFIATRLLRLQIPAERIRWGAIGVAVLGLGALYPGWLWAALILFVLALMIDMVAEHIGTMTRLVRKGNVFRIITVAILLIGIGWAGIWAGVRSDSVHLALLGAITLAVLDKERKRTLPDWAYITPGTILLLMMIGLAAGRLGQAVALGALAAIASLGALVLVRRK